MTQLKVQRALLWLVMLMSIAILPLGAIDRSFWGLTLLGLAMLAGSVLGARRLTREIRAARTLRQTLIGETIFRQEVARTGRLDLARQAIERETAHPGGTVGAKKSA
jgi:enoyl-CoA hydratase/carnithine racemase